MCKVKVVFKNVKMQYREIKCIDWEFNGNHYIFWLDTVDKPGSKVISIPVDNILYVEDLF